MDSEPIEHNGKHYSLEFQFPYSGNAMGDQKEHVYLGFLARVEDSKRLCEFKVHGYEIGDVPNSELREIVKNALRQKAMAYLEKL